jgi:hypothetical protein
VDRGDNNIAVVVPQPARPAATDTAANLTEQGVMVIDALEVQKLQEMGFDKESAEK